MAARRVAGQNRRGEMECVENRNNILAEALRAEARFRMAGRSVSSPCNAVNVTHVGQLGREIVKYVGGISRTSQQNKRSPRSAPIEHFDPNASFRGHELHPMRRGIFPVGRL